MDYEAVIGLEIHAELDTKSKMFCACKSDPFGSSPNSNICPVCLGMPGSLPVLNKQAVEWTIMVGKALACHISEVSKWDRKNYFYPDLPKGYQISQYDLPLTKIGYISVGERKIGITRVHLEEDTGKLMHHPGANYSLVDYNRAGVPLIELVTEPDLKTGEEARLFAQELQLLLRTLGVARADMEKGELRVEVNISLRKQGDKKFGTKVEIKNLNSFRSVEKAINYEIKRQRDILEDGGQITQETRGWQENTNETFSQRIKETAEDYRYFPEPDLPSLEISKTWQEGLISQIKKLPDQRRNDYLEKYNLPLEYTKLMVLQRRLGDYFDQVMDKFPDLPAILVAKWLIHEKVNLEISPKDFGTLLSLVDQQTISGTIGKEVLKSMNNTKRPPEEIIDEKGWQLLGNEPEIKEIVKKVLTANDSAVADFRAGKGAAMGFLIGQVMKETKGQAHPEVVKKMLEEELK